VIDEVFEFIPICNLTRFCHTDRRQEA
jgi:hypothetical protein